MGPLHEDRSKRLEADSTEGRPRITRVASVRRIVSRASHAVRRLSGQVGSRIPNNQNAPVLPRYGKVVGLSSHSTFRIAAAAVRGSRDGRTVQGGSGSAPAYRRLLVRGWLLLR